MTRALGQTGDCLLSRDRLGQTGSGDEERNTSELGGLRLAVPFP